LPYLRDFLFRRGLKAFPTKEIKEDISKLRKNMIIKY
tara:strand:- start:244 stop:354 length:111 start_codon:yes stop_codon:yes gene_type:complete